VEHEFLCVKLQLRYFLKYGTSFCTLVSTVFIFIFMNNKSYRTPVSSTIHNSTCIAKYGWAKFAFHLKIHYDSCLLALHMCLLALHMCLLALHMCKVTVLEERWCGEQLMLPKSCKRYIYTFWNLNKCFTPYNITI